MTRALLILTSILLAAQPAYAQGAPAARLRAGVSLGLQPETTRISQSSSLFKNQEPTPFSAVLPARAERLLDVGVTIGVGRNFGVGLSLSRLDSSGDAAVTAGVPHPFYFDRPRTISGSAFGVRHRQMSFHTGIVYTIAGRRLDLALSGGGSLAGVRQDLVSDVAYSEDYPYDEATFSSATLTEVRGSKLGYHAGADVTWKLSRHWGIGGLLRITRATIPLSLQGEDAGTVEAGGLQAGAGLRLVL